MTARTKIVLGLLALAIISLAYDPYILAGVAILAVAVAMAAVPLFIIVCFFGLIFDRGIRGKGQI